MHQRRLGAAGLFPEDVVNVFKGLTVELALLFGRAFNQSPQYWLNLQVAYDLKTAQRAIRGRLRGMRPLAHA